VSRIDREGVEIHYEAAGAGGDAPPVLFTHGYAASARMWDAQRDALVPRRRAILWDMRGHGASASPEDPAAYSAEATVGDMAAILDACKESSAVLAGMSLGGFMSLAFHRAHPARVRALVLVDTGPGFRSADTRAAWNRYALETADRYAREGLGALPGAPEVASAAHRSARGLELAARGMLVQRDGAVIESLREIRVPTLIVVGAEDRHFLDAAAYMARVIPGAVREVVPGAGHAPNVERPEFFNDLLLRFLEGLGGSRSARRAEGATP
jgi:pimeloyl-ACP methyl ester carboxylesterase